MTCHCWSQFFKYLYKLEHPGMDNWVEASATCLWYIVFIGHSNSDSDSGFVAFFRRHALHGLLSWTRQKFHRCNQHYWCWWTVLMTAICRSCDDTAFFTCHLIINFLAQQVGCPLLLVMCLDVVEASQIVSFWFRTSCWWKTCSAVIALVTPFSAKHFSASCISGDRFFRRRNFFAVLSSQSSLIDLPCRGAEAFWGFDFATLKLKIICINSLSLVSTEK